jgi:hypothetical protein
MGVAQQRRPAAYAPVCDQNLATTSTPSVIPTRRVDCGGWRASSALNTPTGSVARRCERWGPAGPIDFTGKRQCWPTLAVCGDGRLVPVRVGGALGVRRCSWLLLVASYSVCWLGLAVVDMSAGLTVDIGPTRPTARLDPLPTETATGSTRFPTSTTGTAAPPIWMASRVPTHQETEGEQMESRCGRALKARPIPT